MFGTMICGRVGIGASGLTPFYVKTVFFHIGFLPLIPLESRVFLPAPNGDDGCSLCLPLQFRSILMAWLEYPLKLAGFGGFVMLLVAYFNGVTSSQTGRELMWYSGLASVSAAVIYPVLRVLFRYRSEESTAVQMAAMIAISAVNTGIHDETAEFHRQLLFHAFTADNPSLIKEEDVSIV